MSPTLPLASEESVLVQTVVWVPVALFVWWLGGFPFVMSGGGVGFDGTGNAGCIHLQSTRLWQPKAIGHPDPDNPIRTIGMERVTNMPSRRGWMEGGVLAGVAMRCVQCHL